MSNNPSLSAVPESSNPLDDLARMQEQMATLRSSSANALQRLATLDSFFARASTATTTIRPLLAKSTLPLRKQTRQTIRNLQTVLRSLAEDILSALAHTDNAHAAQLMLWQAMHCLAHHLLVSDLASAPAEKGVWRLLHQTFSLACKHHAVKHTPQGNTQNLESIYFAALLLGCSQPSAFTATEINCIADFLAQFSSLTEASYFPKDNDLTCFWVDSNTDAPATPCIRKKAPQGPDVMYFSCKRITSLMENQLAILKSGDAPPLDESLRPAAFVLTSVGQGVMHKLIAHWAHPAKRRFPRRRQSYRTLLCVGIENIWKLFHQHDDPRVVTSHWMTINESPDGYAIMHIDGKTGNLSAGNIVAIRNERAQNWQVCIIRWACSGNNEHIELGIQILATRAIPAQLAKTSPPAGGTILPALILPELPGIQPSPMLITPSNALPANPKDLVLLLEQHNVEIREVESAHIHEQNALIDIFKI